MHSVAMQNPPFFPFIHFPRVFCSLLSFFVRCTADTHTTYQGTYILRSISILGFVGVVVVVVVIFTLIYENRSFYPMTFSITPSCPSGFFILESCREIHVMWSQ